jgi:ribonuclease Z
MDIPNEDYLTALVSNGDQFLPYQSTASSETDAAMVIVHFTPQHIVETETYRQFIGKFSASTTHLLVNDTNK